MIKLTNKQWDPILERIKSEYPPSVWAIRYRMKETLGFTVREYRAWPHKKITSDGEMRYGKPDEGVYLDFFDDVQETFFSMKYL
jgi:hypothetical protein